MQWSKSRLHDKDSEGFNYLQDILIGGGLISKRHPHAEHVNVEFAQAAMQG
jgi:hypothetical protein